MNAQPIGVESLPESAQAAARCLSRRQLLRYAREEGFAHLVRAQVHSLIHEWQVLHQLTPNPTQEMTYAPIL